MKIPVTEISAFWRPHCLGGGWPDHWSGKDL